MESRRRRTDFLPSPLDLPVEQAARADLACRVLDRVGFEAATVLEVPADGSLPRVWACAGNSDPALPGARLLARRLATSGRALELSTDQEVAAARGCVMGAVPLGETADGRLVLVLGDHQLARRDGEAVAAWLAPEQLSGRVTGGACGMLARGLAAEFEAEVVIFSLFTQAGMLLNMHVRSGAVLRAWRSPIDTVWGEAARHSAAFVLGDLHLHPGAEMLASLGMASAAIVGLDNGSGIAIGSVGIAARGELDADIARRLLDRAAALGPEVMSLRSRPPMPLPDATGAVELRQFAARVGCRRFAMYVVEGGSLRLASAHAEDGSVLVSPPDAYEEQLVSWAAEKGIAVVSEDAAAVMVGTETVLYAQDSERRPMECLRLALQDLRDAPAADSGQQAA